MAASPSPNRIEIRPQPAQEPFLSCPADIAVYGGAAGGGKTWSLVVDPLRHVGNSKFSGVVFRRETPQITAPGGLLSESQEWYPLLGGRLNTSPNHKWTFPSGAEIQFRHLQHENDRFAWQGSQVPWIAFDELTHFSRDQFFYFLSRNRSLCGVKPYIRATCNPEPGWVKDLLAPWVDEEWPEDPALPGEVRHFTVINSELTWVSADWRDEDGQPGKSLTFIPATIYDNQALLKKNPEYLASLRALPPVEQARLLRGDWTVRREGLVYPGLRDCLIGPSEEIPAGTRYGGIDWGWHNPAAFLVGTLDHDGVLWVDWELYGSQMPREVYAKKLPRDVARWFADPAGAQQIAELRRDNFPVGGVNHKGKDSLQAGIALVNERIAKGTLKVSRRCRNLIKEAGVHHYDKDTEKPLDQDNHALAALRYLVVGLSRRPSGAVVLV